MRHIPIAEFELQPSEIIAAAEAGEEIMLTRQGRDVVKLVAAQADRMVRQRAAVDAMIATREALRAKGVSISVDELIEWKNEGRR